MKYFQSSLLGLVAALAFIPMGAYAATLSLSPASVSVVRGGTVYIAVLVSSTDKAMNAASGVVSFPTDLLEVVSVSKSNSIASLWVQEPSFSNTVGTVSFEGVVLNPGFTGSGGRLITITLRGKATGTGKLSFSAGSVLANDGSGTEILKGTTSTSIAISAPFDVVPISEEPSASAPATSLAPTSEVGRDAQTIAPHTESVPDPFFSDESRAIGFWIVALLLAFLLGMFCRRLIPSKWR